jgi:hypothetical protein
MGRMAALSMSPRTICGQAIPTFQELSTKLSDTPEGQAATGELTKPQPVMGRFTTAIPSGAFVILAKGITNNLSDAGFFRAVGSPAPRVGVKGDGSFVFTAVAQGEWDLVWGYGIHYRFSYHRDTGDSYWKANVGPLCAVDLGPIDENFS